MSERKPGARLPLSRRAVVVAPAAVFLRASPVPPCTAKSLCDAWLANNTEAYRLAGRWSEVEAWLVRHRRWFKLTEGERDALPEARELTEIDRRLSQLFAERDALLRELPSTKANTADGLAAKLRVLRELVHPADHPETNALVESVIADVLALPARAAL